MNGILEMVQLSVHKQILVILIMRPAGVATKYSVTLKVKDNNGTTSVNTTLSISVNNSPPVVSITSPINNSLYPISGETTYSLRATVTDQEHSGTGLFYQWQTILHHNDHMHPEPITQIRRQLQCSLLQDVMEILTFTGLL
jgi:hypothetical protein